MASGMGGEEMEAAGEYDICVDTLGLCRIEFDEWEESWGCTGVENESRCESCPLLDEEGEQE